METYRRNRDCSICGVGFCAMTKKQFIDEIFRLPVEPVSASINMVGVPGIVSANENPDVAKTYENSTMVIIDGMPIVKMCRKKGLPCDRCAAPDIMPLVFQESVKRGKTHFFYGGKDSTVLKKLRDNLERDYPGIQIVGMYSPPFRPLTDDEDNAVCDEINNATPDFLWVGIGAPKQEIWIQQHQEKIHGAVMLGVGAGFDFFAGTLDKAPAWIEKASLEWAYRLIKEPKRLWKRYVLGGFKWIYYRLKYIFKTNCV